MKRISFLIFLIFVMGCGSGYKILTVYMMPLSGSIGGEAQLSVVCGEKVDAINIDVEGSGEVSLSVTCENFYITVSGDGFYGRTLPLNFSIIGTPEIFVVNSAVFYRLHQLPPYSSLCSIPFDNGLTLLVDRDGVVAVDLVNLSSVRILNLKFNDYVTCSRFSKDKLIVGESGSYTVVALNGDYSIHSLPENITGYSFIELKDGVLLAGGNSGGRDRASTYLINSDGLSDGPYMNSPRSYFKVCRAGNVYIVGGEGMEVWDGNKFHLIPLKGAVKDISGMVCSQSVSFLSTVEGDIYSVNLETGEVSKLDSGVLSYPVLSIDTSDGGYIIDGIRALKLPELYEYPLNLTGVLYMSGVYFESGIILIFTDKGTYIKVEEVKR